MANPIWGRGVCACVSMQRQVTHFDERNQSRDETTKPPAKIERHNDIVWFSLNGFRSQ